MKVKRPFLLYLLAFIFLGSALVLFLGVIGTLRTWNWLTVFSTSTIPLYTIIKGFFLGLTCLTAALLLWLRVRWSILFGTAVAILTATWYWVDRIALTQNPLPFSRHILPLVITFLLLLFIIMSLMALMPFVKLQTKEPNPSSGLPTGGKNDQTTP